jgi:uncharacterized protein (TIGR02118 family)
MANYSVVFLVKKKAGMSPDEFASYWINEHTPLTAQVEGVRAYRCFPFHGGQGGPFDAIAFISFDDQAAADRALASPAFARALADAEHFQTVEETLSFTADEHIIV